MKRLPVALLLSLLCGPLTVMTQATGSAVDLSAATLQAKADVESATQALTALREDIAQQRAPQVERLEQLRSELADLRVEARRLRELRFQGDLEREALDRDVALLREGQAFAEGVTLEYRRSFETRLPAAEVQILRLQLDDIDRQHAHPEAFSSFVEALLLLAEQWNMAKVGGIRQMGRCLDALGEEHDGRYALLGPLAYFHAPGGKATGLVMTRIGSSRPSLFADLDARHIGSIAALVDGDDASVPFDPSGGDALKISAARSSFEDQLKAGGLVMIPILLIGALAAVLTILKLIALRNLRPPDDRALDVLAQDLRVGRIDAARDTVQSLSAPFRSLLEAGISYHDVRKDHLEEILHERALAMIPPLERHLALLAVLGGVAPLLGLLGTVTGMIHTFELVTVFGTGDAKLLSGGISEALLTTQAGLVIAVPVLLIHAFLNRKVRTIVDAMEQTLVGFVNRLHAGGAKSG